MKQKAKHRTLPWMALIFASLSILAGGWAADGIKGEALFIDWFPITQMSFLVKIVITLFVTMIFIGSVIATYKHRGNFLACRSLAQEICPPHECVIIPLSILKPVPDNNTFPLKISIKDPPNDESQKPQCIELNGIDLAEDIERLTTIKQEWKWNWNWEPLLRTLKQHQKKLSHVYLIGSIGSADKKPNGSIGSADKKLNGSFEFIGLAETIIQKYFPEIQIFKHDQAIDFEDFQGLVTAIEHGIKQFTIHGKHESDIIIDVTGGQKPTSIAAAAVTLNSKVTFQYVQTNPPFEVLAYDVVIVPKE